MNVRELLQYEIWSRESSRRILRPVWRFLKWAGIVSGSLVILAGVVFAVEARWLTNGEREAGRAALAKIEELEQLERNASDGFDGTNRQAKTAVEVAGQKAWTLRDRRTVGLLELYRWELETEREESVREAQLKQFMQQRHLQWRSSPKREAEIRSSQSRIFSELRSALHKELD